MEGTAFVGRRGELDRLGRVLRGDTGAATAAVVTGDAGIGKTRLLVEAVRAAPGVLVLSGGCLQLSESLPYGAITDAFDRLTWPEGRHVLDKALSRCAPFVTPQICALIPAMSPEAHPAPDATADRTRLFTAVRDLLGALGAARRTALVVEDLHWSDPGTLDLLTFLVRSLPPGTALVATSRRDELTASSPVLEWLDTTPRLPSVEQVTLAPLPDDDVASLVASLVDGDAAAAFVADVGRRGLGNPFFTEQLVAAARDVAPPLRLPPGVPAGVAQMLLGRVRSVGAAASEVAAALAVAARPLTEPELAVCVGVDVAAGLRELLDTRLAESALQDRYRLRHGLLEDTVRETLLTSQRATLHAGIASVLAGREGENPGEVAAHWAHAGNKVEEAHWSVRAAQHAEGLFAWGKASSAWRRVWELWDGLTQFNRPPVQLTAVVLSCVADARRGDEATLLALAQEAMADDRVTSDDLASGVLLTLYGLRLLLTDIAAGVEALERAVARLDRGGHPSAEQARAVYRLAKAKMMNGATTGTEADEVARATNLAQEVGAVDVLLEIATDRASARLEAGQVAEALADLTAILQRASQGDDDVAMPLPWVALTDARLWLLDLQQGVDDGLQAIDRVLDAGCRDSLGFSTIVSNTVECLLLLGEVDTAQQLVTAHLRPDLTGTGWRWPLHISQAELDLLAGELTTALVSVEHLEAEGGQYKEMLLCLAEVGATADLWGAQPFSAWERTARAWTRVQDSPSRARASRMLAVASRAAADMADTDLSANRELLVEQLREMATRAGCFDPNPARVLGAAYGTTFDAELARLLRTDEEAAWRTAKDTWSSYGVPHQAAYAGWRLAERLLTEGRRKEAESELADAYATAMGHLPLRREVEGLARRARLTLPVTEHAAPSASAAETPDTWHGLTPRELDVLRLLGTGATNAEIGRRLYMSPKTASVHVSAIIRKLGVTGRVQAATVAERMGLLFHERGGDADS